MIPILYEKTETSFTSNGLGRLSDCIRCIVTEERNGIFECEFDYPVSGPMFSQIEEGRVIGCTHDDNHDVQPFDIYGRSEPINGVVTFYAHHISYRLNEITVKPFTASSCADAFTKIVAYSIGSNPFSFWTDKNVNTEFMSATPRQIRNMLGGEKNSILDVYGTGEYEFDKFGVNLYLHRGQDTNVSIRYGKNLVDFTNDYDASEIYTAVVPFWLGEVSEEGSEEPETVLVTLPEWYISSGHSSVYGREVIVPMDLSTVFTDRPTVEQLRLTAMNRLNNSDAWIPNQTVKVNFVQLWQTDEYADYAVLQRLSLCDTCGIFVPMYNISLRAKVIRVVYNVLLDRYDEMELGDKPTTYTAVIEQMYDSKVAGVVEGFKAIRVDLSTITQTFTQAILDINTDIEDIRNQIDGNITTWFFGVDPTMSNPPVAYDPNVEGSGWDTTEKKDEHVGDLYYNTVSGKAWRFVKDNGVYSWNEVTDSGVAEALRLASEAKDTADSKRRIFYTTPIPPYDDGDLWVQGDNPTTGDILRCANPKAEGEAYERTDWIKASKYTDDSAFDDWVSNDFQIVINGIENQVDAKIETWAQEANPATSWSTIELKKAHDGDLWLYTGLSDITVYGDTIKPQGTYKFSYMESGSLANESSVELADENNTVIEANESLIWASYSSISNNIFDLADGKSTIYYGTTTGSYPNKEVGDYLVDSSTGNTYRWTGSLWQKVTDYQTAIASAKSTIEQQYEQAIEDATEQIRGGTGGYIVTTVNANGQPIEFLITDNLNLNQAVNVWRWNSGGLGHSHSGYNGPYNDVAITQDGKINASMILTGALTANIITAGTLKDANNKNSWDLDSGQFKTEQGQIGPFIISATGLTYTGQTSKTVIDNNGIATLSRASIGSDHIVGGAAIKSATIKFTYAADGNYDVDSATVASRIALVRTTIPSINYGIAFFSQSNTLQLGLYDDGATYPVDFTGDTRIKGNFVVASGYTKSREVETDNYGKRLQYSYETPVPMFGDIGEVIIDEDGLGYVDIDDIFSETIADRVEYQVFLQKEGEGDCWIAEKSPRYFVVSGTPGLKVAWELKAKQKEFINTRLEPSENYLDEYEYRNNENDLLNDYITEQEALLYGNY